jgi:hypothetical protein
MSEMTRWVDDDMKYLYVNRQLDVNNYGSDDDDDDDDD